MTKEEEEITDQWIEEFLFPGSGRQPLNLKYIHKELAKLHVRLSLLHYDKIKPTL